MAHKITSGLTSVSLTIFTITISNAHVSLATGYVSPATCDLSPVICHLLPATCDPLPAKKRLSFCLTSPMGDDKLTASLEKYLSSITTFMRKNGHQNVHEYFFRKRYTSGCGSHPSLAEHGEIANELTDYVKALKKW